MPWRRAWAAGVRPTLAREVLAALSAAAAVGVTTGLGAAAWAARINPSLRAAQDATRFLLACALGYLVLFLPLGLVALVCVRWLGFLPGKGAPPPAPAAAKDASAGQDSGATREGEPRSRFPFSTHAVVLLFGLAAFALATTLGDRQAASGEQAARLLWIAVGAALAGIALAAFVATRRLFQGLIGPRRWLIPILLLFSSGFFLLLGIGDREFEEAPHAVEPSVVVEPNEVRDPHDPALAALPAPQQRRVVLLALDGADWERIDALIAVGGLPSFKRLLARGVRASLRGEPPTWSSVAWTTVATGVPPRAHGVCDVTEVHVPGLGRGLQRVYARRGEEPLLPTGIGLAPLLDRLLDGLLEAELVEERLVSSAQRRSKAIWNILAERGLPVAVVRWPASRPAESLYGWVVASDDPWTGDLRLDQAGETADAATGLFSPRELRDELADLLADAREGVDLGLGGTGPLPKPPRPDAAAAAPRRPDPAPPLPIFEQLSEADLAALERDPQLRIEAREALAADAFGARAALRLWRERRPWFLALCLRSLDVLGHRLERIPGAIDGTYRWMDQALGAWLEAAGEEATLVVVSAYGGRLAPQAGLTPAEREHGLEGIFVLWGANVRPGVEFGESPSVYDIAPTLLALYGLPPAREMPGRVLLEALQVSSRPGAVASPESYGPHSLRREPARGPTVAEAGSAPGQGE